MNNFFFLHAWLIMFLSHTSAPELIALLSELNDAIEHLERKVTPLLRMGLFVLFLPYNVRCSIKNDLDDVCLDMD